MARPGADDRLRRILAVIPWVVGEDGPTLAEVCARFGYRDEKDLQQDLDLLFVCGAPPYTPDTLIEVDVADGRVWIRYADWFERPLRLTAAEGLTLVAASSALLGATPADIETPLARGLAKLAGALGLSDEAVDVDLGPVPADELGVLEEAVRLHRQVEIDYYAYGRDELTTRVIDPHVVYSAEGQWYVAAFCHTAGADRLFRVDRVRRATLLESVFPPRASSEAPPVFDPSPADPVVVLDLEPGGAWAATRYPTEEVTDRGQGRLRVRLRVSGEAWLARLLLRLGPDASLVEGDGSAARRSAARLLQRYGVGPADPASR